MLVGFWPHLGDLPTSKIGGVCHKQRIAFSIKKDSQ